MRATYLLPDGTTLTKDYTVAAASRFTIWVDNETFDGQRLLATPSMSTILQSTNGVPVVVERAMWWPGGASGPWYEAHNSPGATSTGTAWALAEGEVGGAAGASTYMLVANTGAAAGERARDGLRRRRRHGGAHVHGRRQQPLQRRRRRRLRRDGRPTPLRRAGREPRRTPAPIVVERAMYTNAGGRVWAAGTNALATKIR